MVVADIVYEVQESKPNDPSAVIQIEIREPSCKYVEMNSLNGEIKVQEAGFDVDSILEEFDRKVVELKAENNNEM